MNVKQEILKLKALLKPRIQVIYVEDESTIVDCENIIFVLFDS